MAQTSRQLETVRVQRKKHPTPDIVTPREPEGEELAEILQMAEDSARRCMDKVRPQMEKAIRALFEK